jgi:hypothetical protein
MEVVMILMGIVGATLILAVFIWTDHLGQTGLGDGVAGVGDNFSAHVPMIGGRWLRGWACNPWLTDDTSLLR